MVTVVHLCVLRERNYFHALISSGNYLRSIHVVEIYGGVGLVQVSDVITMLVHKTERVDRV